jgi:Ran GTPase-activating protein (RanGAP) involved in mRNA processing and transport
MALQQLSGLQHLNMDFNTIALMCATALTSALPSLQMLKFFSIARCRFQQGALNTLSPGLASLTSLRQLDLSDNGMSLNNLRLVHRVISASIECTRDLATFPTLQHSLNPD